MPSTNKGRNPVGAEHRAGLACPVPGCRRRLKPEAVPGKPGREVGRCECGRYPDRAVVERDAPGETSRQESEA